jgi:hypothetical protein
MIGEGTCVKVGGRYQNIVTELTQRDNAIVRLPIHPPPFGHVQGTETAQQVSIRIHGPNAVEVGSLSGERATHGDAPMS